MSEDKSIVDPSQIDEAFVRSASRVAGIQLTAKQLPGVVEQLLRTAALAELVNSAVLDMQDELGPIWRP